MNAGGSGSSILGGNNNTLTGVNTSIINGAGNSNGGTFTLLGSGQANALGGCYSSIINGLGNIVGSSYSCIGGGDSNTIQGGAIGTQGNKIIGGGNGNTIGYRPGWATIINGTNNKIYENNSSYNFFYNTVISGKDNTIINSKASTIAGGNCNIINDSYGQNVYSGFIGGGTCNTINGSYSFVAGGCKNTVSWFDSCVFIAGSNITANRSCSTFVNNLSIMNIPTSPTSLPSGSVWRNPTTNGLFIIP
jgi:hypothetical protein